MSRIDAPSKPCLLNRASATEMIRALACAPFVKGSPSPGIPLSFLTFFRFADVSLAIFIDSHRRGACFSTDRPIKTNERSTNYDISGNAIMSVPSRLDRYIETEKQGYFSRDFVVG